MPRNIVLCCDGTANEFARHNTNVVKLYTMLERDPGSQVTYYHPGLGTMEPAGALTTLGRRTTKLMGMAFGYGLASDIREAYLFLMRNFEPGDTVYLFGFSRGAYTARAIASLLYMYGLIYPDNDALVAYAIRMMMGIRRARRRGDDKNGLDEYFNLARTFKASMARSDTRYVCQSCGAVYPKWAGRCEACEAWNSLVEEAAPQALPKGLSGGGRGGRAVGLVGLDGAFEAPPRLGTGLAELDRVLGGGLVPGSPPGVVSRPWRWVGERQLRLGRVVRGPARLVRCETPNVGR
jgi:hypothetical protein